MKQINHIIDHQEHFSEAEMSIVTNPVDNKPFAQVVHANSNDVDKAVSSAHKAFPMWSQLPPATRANYLFKLRDLIIQNQEDIAKCLSTEHGKTVADALGDIGRGLEVLSHSCGIATLAMGEHGQVASTSETYTVREPLGVCVGITPFNFPAMIPLWMFPMSVAVGNCFVLKPSEITPMTAQYMMRLVEQAKFPPGVINLVNGGADTVKALCTHPKVKAISFVGSSKVGKKVWEMGTEAEKRVQCMMGAKNHAVIMPDSNIDTATKSIVDAAFGAAGQRCMAISVCLVVDDDNNFAQSFTQSLVKDAKMLKVGPATCTDTQIPPLVTAAAKSRVFNCISAGEKSKASLQLDGRVAQFPNDKGNWCGATIFTDVSIDMDIYKEEIFGPVLCVLKVQSLDEALTIINNNPYGNGTSIFTNDGFSAKYFRTKVNVGQVGVNIPIPVPVGHFSFTGAKGSRLGDLGPYGKESINFYTHTKTITERWDSGTAKFKG